jgi:hypothetical protein
MTSYHAEHGKVVMVTDSGPVRLSLVEADNLLGIYDRERAIRDYLDCYQAYMAAGGIERVSSVRARFEDRPEPAVRRAGSDIPRCPQPHHISEWSAA